MTSERDRWRQIRALFDHALALAPARRGNYLESSCGDDPALRAEVESLLRAAADVPPFLEAGALALAVEDQAAPQAGLEDELVGRIVGPWRLLHCIGSGAMGRVYAAERADDAFEMTVAVKLMATGLPRAIFVERFERERQLLAALDHPGIARLIDGGAAEDGSPYLVMERIEGRSIDRHCDTHRLAVNDRLELFRQVCAAVQHAHRNLVVHRDLKPTNILVDDQGTVKLLDFGIAKLLTAEQTNDATQTSTRAMTPRYASPEQIEGTPTSTSSDVYSLGVILFELLSGRRPYGDDGSSRVELDRLVTQQLPPMASVAAVETDSAVAEAEGSRRSLARRLSGDLDNIVAKALRKEPSRRYSSVERLATDIRRHLDGFPVSARPETLGYRSSKFVSRNRALVVVATALVVALVAGAGFSIHYALGEREQRELAERRFDDVRELASTFLTDVDTALERESKTEARKTIVATGLSYLEQLAAESGDDVRLLRDVARGYFRVAAIQGDPKAPSLGDAEAALASALLGEAASNRLLELAPAAAESILIAVDGHLLLADLTRHLGDRTEPTEQLEAALEMRLELSRQRPEAELAAPRLDTVYFRYGNALERLGRQQAAIEKLEHARKLGEALLREYGETAELFQSLAVTVTALSQAYRFRGEPARAAELLEPLRKKLELAARDQPPLRPVLANLRYNLGWSYVLQGDIEQGLRELGATLAFYQALADADPNDTTARRNAASTHWDLGEIAAGSGELEKALEHYQTMVAAYRRVLGRSPESALFRSDVAASLAALGDLLVEIGRAQAGVAAHIEASSLFSELAGEQPASDSLRAAAQAHRRVVELLCDASDPGLRRARQVELRAHYRAADDYLQALSIRELATDEDQSLAEALRADLGACAATSQAEQRRKLRIPSSESQPAGRVRQRV